MISDVAVTTIIGVVTFVLSVGASMFVSGMRWGRIETKLNDLQRDRVSQSDINGMRDRLARIEALFTLTLKDHTR